MSDQIKQQIIDMASSLKEEIISIRRHIHRNPELSFEEIETSKFIQQKLNNHGIPFSTGWAGQGIVAVLNEDKTDKGTVYLRGDMDALPILEQNEVEYCSKNEGVMHACGHDVHTSSLLGAAIILNTIKEDLEGCIRFVFQPGEEKLPGGASIMIKEGLFSDDKEAAIFGQHVHPPLEVGKVGLKPGMYMASADELYITVTGKGGHAALPENCVDPILISCQMLVALQQVVSRKAPPTVPTVLSFGKINSTGGATNIIPNEVKVQGTLRTMDETWRKEAHRHIRKIAEDTASSLGGSVAIDIKVGYPCLVNEPMLTAQTKEWMIAYLGAENVVDLPIRLTAEDFAFFSHEVDGCFYRLGTGNVSKGITSPVHTDTFDIDEDALQVGSGLMAWLAYKKLNSNE